MPNTNYFELLREVVDQVNKGAPEADSLVKTASAHNLYPDQLAKLGYQYNTAKVRHFMDNNPDSRGATVDTVNVPDVVATYEGKSANTKKASVNTTTVKYKQHDILDLPRMPSRFDFERAKQASFGEDFKRPANTMYSEDQQMKQAAVYNGIAQGERNYYKDCDTIDQLRNEALARMDSNIDKLVKVASTTYRPDMHQLERDIKLTAPLAGEVFDVVAAKVPASMQWKRASYEDRGIPTSDPELIAIGTQIEDDIKNLAAYDMLKADLNTKYASFFVDSAKKASEAGLLGDTASVKQAAAAPSADDLKAIRSQFPGYDWMSQDDQDAIEQMYMQGKENDIRLESYRLLSKAKADKAKGDKTKGDGKVQTYQTEEGLREPLQRGYDTVTAKLTDTITGAISNATSRGTNMVESGLQKILADSSAAYQKKLTEKQRHADYSVVLSKLMTDPVLAKHDPQKVADAFSTAQRLSPHLMADPFIAASTIKQMIQYDSMDAAAAKQLADANRDAISTNLMKPTREYSE